MSRAEYPTQQPSAASWTRFVSTTPRLVPPRLPDSFATGPEVPNPINLQTVYFEDFETGYSNGDPVTNKPEWTVGNATVVDSPGVLGGGTAAGLPDGHGLVLGGFVDTTENKVSFGDVTADKVYFSFDLYQTTDHTPWPDLRPGGWSPGRRGHRVRDLEPFIDGRHQSQRRRRPAACGRLRHAEK